MRAICDECGDNFEARTARARLCSNKCRQRAARAAKNGESAPARVLQPVFTPGSPDIGAEDGEEGVIPPLVAATRRELEAAGVLDTVAGHLALELAAQVCAVRDTGSAKAAASKEFRSAYGEAMKDVATKADSLDELASRRLKRASGA